MALYDQINLTVKEIEEISKKRFDELMAAVYSGKGYSATLNTIIKQYPIEARGAIYDGITRIAVQDFKQPKPKEPSSIVSSPELSKSLYNNLKATQSSVGKIIKESIEKKQSVQEVALKIYEGYKWDGVLDVKGKVLPKYLEALDDVQAAKLKTPALKAAYTRAIEKAFEDDIRKALEVAFFEKMRYLAARIARTELAIYHNTERVKEFMAEPKIKAVKIKLSAKHPRPDICDYFTGVDLYGLGAGVYPKDRAPVPPYHPHCLCRMVEISYMPKEPKLNPKADAEFARKVDPKRLLYGKQLEQYNGTGSFWQAHNAFLPDRYKTREAGGVVEAGIMQLMTAHAIEDLFVQNLSDFSPEKIETFSSLFTTNNDYERHLQKRLDMGHIEDDIDYALKTFIALSSSTRSVFETYPQKSKGVWDRILYDSKHSWVVILGENGKILTSFYMNGDFDDLIKKHKEQHGAKVMERGESENLRTTSKKLRDRLTVFYDR